MQGAKLNKYWNLKSNSTGLIIWLLTESGAPETLLLKTLSKNFFVFKFITKIHFSISAAERAEWVLLVQDT